MASAAEAIQIGPFVGGLNLHDDPTSVGDSEGVEMLNFELDFDGSLKSRPPITDLGINMPLGATGNMHLLGYYNAAGGVAYLLGSDGLNSTYYYSGAAWVLITNTIAASAMLQFDNKAWLLAPVGAANPGGYWDPVGGFITQPNMPKGDVIVTYKFRLWVAAGKNAVTNGTRLYFSDLLGVPSMWAAVPGFIDVGAGDGQNIIGAIVYQANILIFRSDSVYAFQYTSDPAAGVASILLPGIGLASKECLTEHEGYIYFLYEDKLYEFVNSRANQINVKVPFAALSKTGLYLDTAVSLFNNRVIVSYFDTMYIFGLKTRTWTRWRSTARGAIGRVLVLSGTGQLEAIAHSSAVVPPGGGRVAHTLHISEELGTDTETFQCILQTKNYTYDASSVFKRLFWWGVDAIFRGTVTGLVTPVTYNFAVTWGQLRLAGTTWGDLLNFTWGQPSSDLPIVETQRTGGAAIRKFVKFNKGLRFRQINFKVTFDTDGSTNSAPVRLFSLMTYVRAKQRVSKPIS